MPRWRSDMFILYPHFGILSSGNSTPHWLCCTSHSETPREDLRKNAPVLGDCFTQDTPSWSSWSWFSCTIYRRRGRTRVTTFQPGSFPYRPNRNSSTSPLPPEFRAQTILLQARPIRRFVAVVDIFDRLFLCWSVKRRMEEIRSRNRPCPAMGRPKF